MEELKRNSQVGPGLSLKGVSATNALSVSIPVRQDPSKAGSNSQASDAASSALAAPRSPFDLK